MVMKKNITVSLPVDVARWARVLAAEHDTSVSRMLGDLLCEHMEKEQAYDAAMRSYLERRPRKLKSPGEQYPARDAVHGR